MDKNILEFLSDLSKNNNREWFAENKNRYEEARAAFLTLVDNLINSLSIKQPLFSQLKSKDVVFRIYKDVRFSKDKLPYKTQFGAYLAPGGRKSPLGGYYLHVEPGNSFLAGGVYCPDSENLKAIRSEIYFNLAEFEKIIAQPTFKKLFGEIKGSKLTRPPKDFPKDFEGIEYLKFKDFTLIHPVSDEDVLDADFHNRALEVFGAMDTFNSFLNRGLENKPDALL